MFMKDLVIGAECGGSDFTSGLAGNVVVGNFYDLLVDLGGTAIFEEIVEAVGLDRLLVSRGVDEQARGPGLLPGRAPVFRKPGKFCRGTFHH